MNDWNEQVCVITGAGSGIGAGLAQHAAKLGMRVVAADVDTTGLEALAARLLAQGREIATRAVDVSNADAVDALAESVFHYSIENSSTAMLQDALHGRRTIEDPPA